jgi:hypothetical protein
MLKEYEYQAEVINALLGQRLWRRGKRARWHERRAVLLTRYLCFDEEGKKKQHVLREAMRGVVEALRDEDTGIGEVSSSLSIFVTHDSLINYGSLPTKPRAPPRSARETAQSSGTRAMCV